MSGLNQHYQDYYLLPGTYSYPMATHAAPTASAYLPNYEEMSWHMPDNSAATYVASPLGVINYLSDLQSQMALPTQQNLSSGLFYAVLNPLEQHVAMPMAVPVAVPVPVPVSVPAYHQAIYACQQPVEQICYYQLVPMSEEDTSTGQQPEDYSAQPAEAEEQAMEPAVEQEPTNGKRAYQAEEGYLVEEPTSSEEDQEESKEEPTTPETH
ncbi:uncharacterized protein LOC108156227 [Drosophila miranda]|uniref:uncharacterized protein LOC108156227 n=1 Tax=Drosophila miranda TaxID=7229 RepID=UPI0007E78C06|nr:uncharacterized protein LOC108156227 [Drosophila miranda]